MYIYSFTHYPGQDSIYLAPDKLPKKYKIGDLLWVDGQYAVLIGKEVSFIEKYTKKRKGNREVLEHYPKFLKLKTLQMIHRMTYQRYTTYKKIMPLFLPKELDYLLGKQPSKTIKKEVQSYIIQRNHQTQLLEFSSKKKLGQTLIVFPDLWTMHNYVRLSELSTDTYTLTSQATILQRSKAYRGITLGRISTLLVTHSNIFQNRHSLEEIVFIQPHRWYYSNQQEPRYKADVVLSKMAEIYGSTLTKIQ